METRTKRTKVLISVLALACLLLFWMLATAGDLEPSGPPVPTMKTLDDIYDAATAAIEKREGLCSTFVVGPYAYDEEVFTVPPGKEFVLLQLHFTEQDDDPNGGLEWSLYSNPEPYDFFIDSQIQQEGPSDPLKYRFDFPDRCAVVHAGQMLLAYNRWGDILHFTLVGYYYSTP